MTVMTDASSAPAHYTKAFQLPEGARPTHDSHLPAVTVDGKATMVVVQADGWVLADPTVGTISLDSISFTVD